MEVSQKPLDLRPPVPLIGDATMEWSEFHEVEKDLVTLLNREDLNISQRIFALYHRGFEVSKAKLNNREVLPLDESIKAGSALQGASERTKAALIRAIFLAFMEETNRHSQEHTRVSFTWSFLVKIVKTAFGWSSINIPTLGVDVKCSEVDSMEIDWNTSENKEIVRKYFGELVTKGRILADQGLYSGVCTLVIAYSLVCWYARALALNSKRTAVTDEDLCSSLGIIDKFLVRNTEGVQKLISGGVFSLPFESLMAKSAVVGSLASL